LRPSTIDSLPEEDYARGSLSDFSDYDSDDGESDDATLINATNPNEITLLEESSNNEASTDRSNDPFADPFADQEDVATPGTIERKGSPWR
jgi:hypothetical protein